MEKIRIGICGYGNLGKGVEKEIIKSKDMELVSIFTRRNPKDLKTTTKTISIDEVANYQDKIDVMIMCGGSATDLPKQVEEINKFYNTVDSFDTHAKIPEYFEGVNKNAIKNKKISIISGGWDPGLFSVMRTYMSAILQDGKTYTFWGKGVSQGHSDAIRRINGVKNAIQYTIPIEKAMEKVRNNENPNLTTKEKHLRECFVVAEDEADLEKIEEEIKTMPNYFNDYETIVNFISEEELKQNHSKMSHGGFVIHSGSTGENQHIMEFSLKLDSNPEFTSSVLIALARANYKMQKEKNYGAKTILDIPPAFLSPLSNEELRKTIL
ncbi:MAG: diaminopimelate dehydrogenase [Bacilli bacterium]|nr:diaminopimelate dehydrogenase [Bacilli bacterium]